MENNQKANDNIYFYSALFYKLARKNNFTRKDFQALITETCNYLPIRGGGSDEDGFWANVCKTHEVQIFFKDGHIDDETVLRLADAMWLTYDQDLRNEANLQKKLNVDIENTRKTTKKNNTSR